MKFICLILLFSAIEIQSFYRPPENSPFSAHTQAQNDVVEFLDTNTQDDQDDDQGWNPISDLSYIDYKPMKTSLVKQILGKLVTVKESERLKYTLDKLEQLSKVVVRQG